jgi:PAS domain S-box-containing protein
MLGVDTAVLADPARLAAVERARRALPAMPLPPAAAARLSARLLGAPMALVALVGRDEEFRMGTYGTPEPMSAPHRVPLAYSVGTFVVSAGHAIDVPDLLAGDDPPLRHHLLATEYGVRAFLGVPVRDAEDRPVGALTVLDLAPRRWCAENTATLLEIEQLLRPAAEPEAASPAVAALDTMALLDSAQEAFLAVRPDGVVVGFNRAAEELLGYDRAQVCGRPLDGSLLPEYDGQPVGAALTRLFGAAPARPVRRAVRLRHRDGHRFGAEVSLSVVRGDAGALACVFITDQSGRQAAEEQVEDHARFLAALLDSLYVGVLACDADGRAVLMNRALRQVHGCPEVGDLPPDYPGRIGDALFDGDHRPMPWVRSPIMRACAGEQVEDTDVVIDVPAGQARTFSVTARPIVAHDGRRLGGVAVSHEVTAVRRVERFRDCHRQVERVLEAATTVGEAAPQLLRAVATTLGWPAAELFLVNENTGELRAVGHWSDFAREPEDFFGHVPVKGVGITGRVWLTGRPVWIAEIADAGRPRTEFEKQRARICIDHGVHTVLAVPVRDGGTLLGVLTCYAGAPEHLEDLLTVLLDGVAAQIGVFVALRQAEELARQLTRAQDDFIALAGHELRTPLTAIAAHAAVLSEDSDRLDPELRQTVGTIARNTAALQTLVDRLLDLAGLESGHLGLVVRPTDLAAIVAAARAATEAMAAGHGVRIETSVPARLPLDGDPDRLRQLLDDLLANAVNYSPPGSVVRVGARAQGSTVELTVADDGIGTPADERERVFDRFYRASNVRHQGTRGNGLGLSLARAVVRRHGGSIRLDGRLPTGTTVVVQLPRLARGTPA